MNKMNLEDIQNLIKFVAKSGATEVDLEFEGVKISIKSPPKKRRGQPSEPITVIQQASPETTESIPKGSSEPSSPIIEDKKDSKLSSDENQDSDYITIKSSMIGTFYRSSSPENPPFINVGDTIKEGDTICIIEAMKLFNEIESDVSGTIVKVLVDDATPIEFDQDLFLLDPS